MASWMGAGRVALESSQLAYEGTRTRVQQALNALKFYRRALQVDSSVWMVSRIDREYANTGIMILAPFLKISYLLGSG